MGLRNLASLEEEEKPKKTGGLRSLATSVSENPDPGINIDGRPANRPSEIGPTPKTGPIRNTFGAMNEFIHGTLEGVVPFGGGKKIPRKDVLSMELVDHTMEYDRSLVKKPDVSGVPVIGEAIEMFNIPNQFSPEVKSKLMARKAGRLIGEFARYAVIERIVQGAKLPEVLMAGMNPKAQKLARGMMSGALSGITEDVPEKDWDDALMGMAFRGGVGAIAMPAFQKLIDVGAGMKEAAVRDSTLWALREARQMMFTGKQALPEHLNTFMRKVGEIRARRLMREAAIKDPKVAEEAEKLAKEFAKKPEAPAKDVTQPATNVPAPDTVKTERLAQAMNMPDEKLRNEIVVLELRANDEPARAASLRAAAKELRTELNKRNLEKARQAKQAKAQAPIIKKAEQAAVKKAIKEAPSAPPRIDIKAKTGSGQFVKLAEQGTGVIKELAKSLEPGADPIQRANVMSKIRRILDRSSREDVHVGTIPAGGNDAKTRIKWEEFFPDELKLEYRRQGSSFNVYVKKANAGQYGPPSGIKPKRIDPEKEAAQIGELEQLVEMVAAGKVEGLKEYAAKNKLGNKQYVAFLQNWIKKNATSEVPTKITPAQAKQGFDTPPATQTAREVRPTISPEEEFFQSIGATVEKPVVQRKPTKPKKTGPVMALKDKQTGQVYSDPEAALHADVLIKNNLDAANVERGVIVDGAYRPIDKSGLEAHRTKIHDIGNKANGLSIQIQNMQRENPNNPAIAPLRKEFKQVMAELDRAKDDMSKAVAQETMTTQKGYVRINGGGPVPPRGDVPPPTGGTPAPDPIPTPQGPEGVRPRQFPDKGDINPELFKARVQGAIRASTVFFDISGKTRGKLTLPEIEALAKKGQLTVDQLAGLPEGTSLPAEELLRARNLVSELFALAKKEVDFALRMPDDPVAQANAASTVKLAIDTLTSTRGAVAEAGRSLRILRTANAVREFTTAEAQSILDGLSTSNFNTYLRAFSEAVDRADMNAAKRSLNSLKANKNFFDKLVNFSNALYLTSPQTDIVNITGNSLALLTSMAEIPFVGAVDAVNSAIRRTPRTRFASEAVVEGFSVIEGIREGVGDFAQGMLTALKGGHPDPGKMGELMGGGVGQGAMEFTSNLIFSRLSATDMFFKAVKKRMSINAQAYRMALLENLEGEALMNRIHNLKTRPTKRMLEEADARALETTFQEGLGAISNKINKMRNDAHLGPYLRVLLPFFKTPVNLMRFAGRRSPLALTPGSKSFRQMMGNVPPSEMTVPRGSALPADVQQSQSEAIGRFIMGSMLAAWVAIETMRGNITGIGPKSQKQRELMEGKGWMGSSFKVGNSYRSYRRFEPLAYVIQPIATITERLMKHRDSGQPVTPQEVQDVVGASIGFVLDSTFLHQLKETVDFLSGKNPDYVANLVAGRVAIPGVQFVNRVFFDPVIRKPKGLTESIQARIPGQSQNIAPDIRATGEERVVGKTMMDRILPFQKSDMKENPAFDEMLRLGVTMPDQGDTFQNVKLTAMERAKIEKAANSQINEVLNRFVNSADYELMGDAERKSSMKALIKGIREVEGFRALDDRAKESAQ